MSNPAQPTPGTALCRLEDLPDPGSKGFLFREGDYLFLGFVTRTGGAIAGWIDRCPHAGMPLAMLPNRYLTREGDLILCASHGALFRPSDGLCLGGPCAGKSLWPWEVELVDGVVVTG